MLSNRIFGIRSNVRSECGRIKGEIYNGNKKGVTRTFFSDVFSHGRIWDHHSRHSVPLLKRLVAVLQS